jgi:hypothetical protein
MGKTNNQNQSRWPHRLVYCGAHCQRVKEACSMTAIEWEDPPAGRRPGRPLGGAHHEIAAELRRNPGRWAKVITASTALATKINAGKYSAYTPKGEFEAVARNPRTVDGKKSPQSDIYVRFVGNSHIEETS